MKPILLALAFICVASFKFFDAMSENEFIPGAIMFTAMFGAPQLIWLWFLRTRPLNDGQIRSAAFTLTAFLFTSVLFGSFPSVSRPSWGGEGHFEVPAALLVEGFISVLGILVFVARGKRKNESVA